MTTMLVWAARSARLMLALAAIAWVAGCAASSPPQAASDAAFDDEPFGKHQIRLLRDGTEIEFVGGIGTASATALEKALNENPRVRVVRLTSPGGSALLAERLERAINAKDVITYVPTFCASACTMVFLGGRERYVAPGARLGFHRGSDLIDSPADSAELADALKSWMLSRGVAADFVARAMSTPPTSIWYPTVDQLLRAGVLTAATSKETFAEASAAERSPDLVNGISLDTPVNAALKRLLLAVRKADPAAYQRMQNELHQAVRSGSYEPGESQLVSGNLNPAFKRAAAIAADDAVVDFVRVWTERIAMLSATDPDWCVAAAGKPDRTRAGRPAIPQHLFARQITAMTAIFETSVSKPQPPPSAERVRQLIVGVLRDMERASGGAIQHLARPDLDPRRRCALHAAVLKHALTLGPGDRSVLLRGMLSDMI